jgi:16S rRNA (cytosine967-C5)-methyltransferase
VNATWQRVADVVADWFLRRLPPRDAIAERRDLRALAAAERSEIARRCQVIVAQQRRLEFAVRGAAGLADLPPHRRAAVLVMAHLVDAQELLAATATRQLAPFAPGVDLSPMVDAPARIARIPDPTQQFAIRHSLPDWLAARFVAELGAEAETLAKALAAPAPRTIRTNTLRVASREALQVTLSAAGVATRATAHAPYGLLVDGDADLFATDAYAAGQFEQQDEGSQLIVLATAPPPGGTVLDLCAGSGGKTLALAAALQNRGEVLATDVHEGRLEALRQRARRAGASNVRALAVGELDWGDAVAKFAARADRILLDAPCSGVGSWRRHPEARWLLEERDLDSLLRTQDALLDRAIAAIRPGARLVYATCSLLPSENEARIAALRQRHPRLELVRLAEILGGATARPIADPTGTFLVLRPDRHGCDGFFAAVLRSPRDAAPRQRS